MRVHKTEESQISPKITVRKILVLTSDTPLKNMIRKNTKVLLHLSRVPNLFVPVGIFCDFAHGHAQNLHAHEQNSVHMKS